MIKLYQGDCLDIMKSIEDKSIDMILCDLPYDCTNSSNKMKKNDILIPFDKLWEQYNRIIKDNGAIVLFCQGKFMFDLYNSNPKMFRYDLIWNKKLSSGFLNAKRMPLRVHENILVFYKELPTYNPQFTIGKPLHGKGTSYLTKELKNQNYGNINATPDTRKGSTEKFPTSILDFQKVHPSKAVHKTEKSIQLCEWLIKTYTNENELVLDNCMGSGTTGIACKNTNRSFIGIELDPYYFDIANKRINGEQQS